MKKIIYIIFVFIVINCILNTDNCFCQWQPDMRLTNDPNNSATTLNNAWCIATSGNFVHVIWYDNRDGNMEIYYKCSTNQGISWGSDVRLTNNTAWSGDPSIAAVNQYVYIVWADERDGLNKEIYFKRSSDNGLNWSQDTRLTNNTAFSVNPSMSVSGSMVFVVWRDNRDGNSEIYFKRSTDNGLSWSQDIRLTNNPWNSVFPTITVSGSVVHVFWNDDRNNGNLQVFYKYSTDSGLNWNADIQLTNNQFVIPNPTSASSSGSYVYIVYDVPASGIQDLYYKRSVDGGISWEPDIRLTMNPGISITPSIAAFGSAVHIVWRDDRDGNAEIYYKCSTDNGVNWGVDTRLTNATDYSEYASVAVLGSIIHVVWEDERDGNNEIYYKQNPTGNPFGIKKISSEIPSKFILHQNYPNPFNPVTKFKVDIAKFGNVKIIIYDVLGREITTLVNEYLTPGRYEVEWDGTNYPSGVYFYKLTTTEYTDTKRMIFTK